MSTQSPSANGDGQFPEPPMDRKQSEKPTHVERGGEVHADTPDKWSEDDKARQEGGVPKSPDKKELPVGKEVPGSNHEGYAEAKTLP